MPTLGDRVSIVEEALVSFMAESARVLAAIQEDIAEIRLSNARTNRQLLTMQQQADKDRQQADQDRQQADQDRQQAEKDRQQADKDRQQAEKDRRDFNKRLAEMSDAQGLLIENMVWPNLPHVATDVFGGGPVLHRAIRIKRRLPGDPSQMMELDLMAVGESQIIICEAKSKITVEKIKDFLDSLVRLGEFFPEYADHKLHPMLASIYVDPGVLKYMTSNGVLALGFGGETMDLLNPEAMRR